VLSDGRVCGHGAFAARPLGILAAESGEPLRRFGRRGQGPGERGALLFVPQAEGGSLAVLDTSNRHVHRFDLAGNLLSSDPIWRGLYKAVPTPDGAGFLIETVDSDETRWWNSLLQLSVSDPSPAELLRLPRPAQGSVAGEIQGGRAIWTLLGDEIVGMWTTRSTVTVWNRAGQPIRELLLPLTTRRLTESEIERELAEHGAMASSLETGPTPFTNELWSVDDSTFAMLLSSLRRAAEDPPLPSGTLYWRLITLRGEYLGTAELPEGFRFLGRGSETIWGRRLLPDGLPVIEEYRLEPVGS
jgi:hypothetical protein